MFLTNLTEKIRVIRRNDLENFVTADSPAVTEKVIRLLDEAKGGMAGHGVSLTLGNLILEAGVMGYVRKAVNGSGGRARFIPVVNRQGEPAWPDKYVKTDANAAAVNADIADPGKRKISLVGKRRGLNAGGRLVYEVEMLLDPVAAGSPFFDRATIYRLIAQCTQPAGEKAGLHLWQEY